MKIAIRAGHNKKATGASALLVEIVENRLLLPLVIQLLRIAGHDVLDVTPGECDTNTDLSYGVRKANEWGADLFVSLHFNKCYASYEGKIGTEVCVYNSASQHGTGVVKALSDLGFRNRGLKVRPELYELRATNMEAMIIETCFVEATGDVELYNTIGVDKIAKAIVNGITGYETNFPVQEESKPQPLPDSRWDYAYDVWVKKLQLYLNDRGHNISPDGKAGDLTYGAVSGYTLSLNEKATLARLVQERLNSMGYGTLAIDGDVGTKTYKAINDFQRANGLGVGYLGSSDWYYLIR